MNRSGYCFLFLVSVFTVFIWIANTTDFLVKDGRKNLIQTQAHLERNILLQTFSSAEKLTKYSMQNCQNTTSLMNTLEIKNKKLVLLVPASLCEGCLIEELKNLQQISYQIGDTNMLILTRFPQKREAKIWKLTQQIAFPVYNSPVKPVLESIERERQLALFVLDSTYIPQHVFIPTPYLPDLTNKYYSFIKALFKPSESLTVGKKELGMKVDKINTDLGHIKLGKTAKTSFVVTNTGSAPLIIYSVYPTCSCLTIICDKSPLPVGKQRKIEVLFHALHAGPFSHKVVVSTDRDQKGYDLTVAGTVECGE